MVPASLPVSLESKESAFHAPLVFSSPVSSHLPSLGIISKAVAVKQWL